MKIGITGTFENDYGMARLAHVLSDTLEQCNIEVRRYSINHDKKKCPWGAHDSGALDCPIIVHTLNPPSLVSFQRETGLDRKSCYQIGAWTWETTEFPDWMKRCLTCVDEIWSVSHFMRDVFAAHSTLPVTYVPLPIPVSPTNRELRAPGPFRFSCQFDFCSVYERKNPDGALQAFLQAFPEPGEAELWIKSVNASSDPARFQELSALTKPHPHVHFIDGFLPRNLLDWCSEQSDCLISLHRSEGYGFHLAEAMARSTPVVATGWSGNMSFMSENTGFIAPYELTRVGEDAFPYPGDGFWAEPDVSATAHILRTVFHDTQAVQRRVESARKDLLQRFSPDAIRPVYKSRLLEIRDHLHERGLPRHTPLPAPPVSDLPAPSVRDRLRSILLNSGSMVKRSILRLLDS